jgi:periplasmic copper chaperone A
MLPYFMPGTQPTNSVTFVIRNPERYQVSNLPLAKRSFAPREQHVAPDDSTDGSPPLTLGSTDRWRRVAMTRESCSGLASRAIDCGGPLRASLYLIAVALVGFGPIAGARCKELIVSDGWVQAAEDVGLDVPLSLTIRNEVDSPDALLRVRCPVTNFSEKHIVDHGEGAPAMRSIPSIPVPPNSTVVLSNRGYHVMLLQTNRPLAVDDRFVCTFVFQKAGAIEAEVKVRGSP